MLWLVGTVRGQRVRESAGTVNPQLAEERRAAREAEIYRSATHGVRPTRTFGEAALSYLKRPRSQDTKRRLNRFLAWLKQTGRQNVRCDQVMQELLDAACEALTDANAAPATKLREVFTPVKAVLRHAAIRGWCAIPVFESIRQGKRRKEWLTPEEAERIVALSPSHLAAMFEFMFCTGARRSEVLSLDWAHVQLRYARATLREVKSRPEDEKDRIVDLPPRAIAALAILPGTKETGTVFRRANGRPWHPDPRISGAQINRQFQAVAREADILRRVSLHVIRHSWASWHYAVHGNLKKLKEDGAWESLDMADRYSHLAPEGMKPEILAFWYRGIIAAETTNREAEAKGSRK
ncbi:tyrosine-type recombinase/integrase [Limobrevibacterium gyesilva]|nr:site-specific integrase [Limobrevibacterium gyesilva]